MKVMIAGAGAMSLALGGVAWAQQPGPNGPPAVPQNVQSLLNCRALTNGPDRLACFDRESAAVAGALASRDLVVVSKEQVRSSRRSLFGLSLPSLAIFGGNAEDGEDAIREVEGVIATATQRGDDNWIIRLQDGAVWTQTDSRQLATTPKAGLPVKVRRAALGSYIMNINGGLGIRVKRTN